MFVSKSTVATAAVAAVLGASLVSAKPVRRQTESMSPCANITQQYQQAAAKNDLASEYVIEFSKYIQFQSTIPFLLNPPDTYLSPAVDLLGGLQAIYQKANSSQYSSQYELETDLNNLISSANDGHLSISPCTLGIFKFSQAYSLVSVSEDGVALPKIYTSDDARLLVADNVTDISDVVTINGQDAVQYLEALGLTQSNQDPDAQYNDVFASPAKGVAGDGTLEVGAFASNDDNWPGTSSFVLAFSNGSTATATVMASTQLTFNFTDGQSLFETLCLPSTATSGGGNGTTTTDATQEESHNPTATAGPLGYGKPIIRDPYNKIIGYYLDDADFNDTAVLFVPNFETEDFPDLPLTEEETFSYVASQFVNQSVADGKTKIVIDVSGNPGGTILSGFDLFRLFFPDLLDYSATRLRDHPAERLMMQAFSALDPVSDANDTDGNPFYYGVQVTPDQNSSFQSWEDLYGPDEIQGANMSALYANFNFTTTSTVYSPIRGYGGIPLNVSSRPFEAENILVVSDGFCASTCTTFVNLMTNPQFGANAKSLAFGGRPINAPMQIIGGVRGGQSDLWSDLAETASDAYKIAQNTTKSSTPIWSKEEFALAEQVLPIPFSEWPIVFNGGNLNLRNAYNPDDSDTPLQFTYQAADCKLFYTLENFVHPNTTWVSAANAVWGNGACVAGSTNSTNSTSSTPC